MNKREELLELYPDEELLFADGFDEAIMGVEDRTMRVIYSIEACIQILMKDMNYAEAMEYFDFNVSGAYIGEQTPIWCSELSI